MNEIKIIFKSILGTLSSIIMTSEEVSKNVLLSLRIYADMYEKEAKYNHGLRIKNLAVNPESNT